jgi:hypothetical protein
MRKFEKIKIKLAERFNSGRVDKAIERLRVAYDKQLMKHYPQIEEDYEGISIWENPKKVKMQFKGITPEQGYSKTMEKFRMLHIDRFINCYIEGIYVVVEY